IGWLVSGTHRTSVAVLPLSNATQDSTLAYLAEGLTQGVTAALSRVPGLRVADPVAMQDVDAAVAWTLRRQGDSLVLAVELRSGSGESIGRARGLFAQAIERDPVYAVAYAGLGYSYVGMAYYWVMPSREAYPLAEAAARRALQIDSTLGFAHALVAEATASF